MQRQRTTPRFDSSFLLFDGDGWEVGSDVRIFLASWMVVRRALD